jgi:hypothetical protein
MIGPTGKYADKIYGYENERNDFINGKVIS